MADFAIRPIRNDDDHRAALLAIERLWDAEPGTEAYDRRDLMTTSVRKTMRSRKATASRVI